MSTIDDPERCWECAEAKAEGRRTCDRHSGKVKRLDPPLSTGSGSAGYYGPRPRPFIPGQPTQEERIRRLEVNQRLLYLWLSEVSCLLHGLLRGGVETQPEDLSRLLNAAQAVAQEMER